MSNKRGKVINYIAMAAVLFVLILAFFLKNQTITYDIAGSTKTSVLLESGQTVVQTYSPNRRDIKEFDFGLSGETELSGEYTLVVTEMDDMSGDAIYNITSSYSGEKDSFLRFKLPKKYNPTPGVRMNLFLKSDAGNAKAVELAADPTYRSAFIIDGQSGERVLGDATLDLHVVSEKNYKWFLFIYILIVTIGVTLLISLLFGGLFEDNVALAMTFSVFFAYILGMLGLLKFAAGLVFIAAVAGIVLYFIDCNKKDILFYKNIDSGMLLWVVAVAVLFATIRHTYIGDPDSVFYINKCRYMFWTDKLAVRPGYAFFLPMLAYLFETVNGVFSEDVFLIAIKIYEFAVLFAFLNIIKVKNEKCGLLYKLLFLGLCTVLAIAVHPSAYFTALMDIPFAITLSLVIKNLYPFKTDKFSMIRTISTAIVLVMIKRSGLPVVMIISVILMIQALRLRKNDKDIVKRYLKAVLIFLLCCIIAGKGIDIYSSHTQESIQIDSANDYEYIEKKAEEPSVGRSSEGQQVSSTEVGVKELVKTTGVKGVIDALDGTLLKKLIATFFSVNVLLGMSYAEVLGVMLLIPAVVWLIRKDDTALEFLITVSELVLASLMYYGIIAYKYLFVIEAFNRYSLNAYDRYAIHFIGAVAIYEVLYLVKVLHTQSDEKRSDLRLFVLTLVMLVLVCLRTDFESITSEIDYDIRSIEARRDALEREMSIYYGYGHPLTIYMPDSSFDQAQYYVKRINLEYWNSMASFNRSNIASEDMVDDYANYLYNNFEYLYLVNYDSDFLKYGAKLFKGEEQDIKRHALYHVDKNPDGTVALSYLGQIPFEDNILRTPDGASRIGG